MKKDIRDLTTLALEIMDRHRGLISFSPPEGDTGFFAVWAHHYAELAALAGSHLQRPARVLEVGLGYGILASMLRAQGHQVVSLEHPSRTDTLTPGFTGHVLESGIGLVFVDLLESLPFPKGAFDAVFLCDVIEHIEPSRTGAVFERVARVLAPGGAVLISMPNLGRLGRRWSFLRGRSPNPPVEVRRVGDTFDHIREYLPAEMESMGNQVGLRRRETRFWHLPYFDPAFAVPTRLLGRVVPSLLEEFAMVLRNDNA